MMNKRLSDLEIANYIEAEQNSAIDYQGELSKKRASNLNYYNAEPFGDEVKGQSSAMTTDVSDVIEWMMPSLIRIFTQSKHICEFEATQAGYEDEAMMKTELSNYVFMRENNGLMTLYNMFKDALLQFTGTVKVFYEEEKKAKTKRYKGLSTNELLALSMDANQKIDENTITYEDTEQGRVYNLEATEVKEKGKICYENIPPEEFLVSKNARDFKKPIFIGHRSPKTRSELLEMGFDRKIVESLPADNYFLASEESEARHRDLETTFSGNPANHHPNDMIFLGEYYYEMDVNGDGITEYWQIFYAGNKVLDKQEVDDHPFCVCVPIPTPHRAIGTCPAEQVKTIQFRKTHLLRQLLDNVYQSNYPRVMHSNKVDLDDLLTPRPGGTIEVDTDVADVGGHAQPLVIPNMIEGVMQAIEYTDMEREIRTGITRYSQGLDSESLNKTATGFKGIMDASQQRLYLIAAVFAEGGVKEIFKKTVKLLGQYQDTAMQIMVTGEALEINPSSWSGHTRCRINVGIGSGDRQEKIMNLNNILMIQERYMTNGLVLSDQTKIFNTLEKLIDEVGLKEASEYFNNPEMPEQTLMAQLYNAQLQIQALQQQVQQNPLAEAELIKAQARMAEVQGKETNQMRQFIMKYAQEDEQFKIKMQLEAAKLAQNGDQFAATMMQQLAMSLDQDERDKEKGMMNATAENR